MLLWDIEISTSTLTHCFLCCPVTVLKPTCCQLIGRNKFILINSSLRPEIEHNNPECLLSQLGSGRPATHLKRCWWPILDVFNSSGSGTISTRHLKDTWTRDTWSKVTMHQTSLSVTCERLHSKSLVKSSQSDARWDLLRDLPLPVSCHGSDRRSDTPSAS